MKTSQQKYQNKPFQSSKGMFNTNFFSIITIVALTLVIISLVITMGFPEILNNTPSLTVTVAGTNDIHGTFYSRLFKRTDNQEKYDYGGLLVMAQMLEIIKNENPNRFLYLDAGDQFQGGFESSKEISSGEIMADYYNHMKIGAQVAGNHQFDFGPQFLTNYLKKLNNKILSANLIDSSYTQNDTKYRPLYNQEVSRIFSFPIDSQIQTNLTEIKVGVIGLSTLQTLYTTAGFTESLFPITYKFLQYKQVVIKQAYKLRQKGANAIIIVSHVGNKCDGDTTYGIWTQNNMGNIENCQKNDQIFKLIDLLPEGTIDAVFQGHRHTISHYFYKGIPILGTINGGYYFNTLQMKFNILNQSILLDKSSLKIEGPIPVCQKVFQNTNKCEYLSDEKLSKAGRLINWKFHGTKVSKDEHLAQLAQSKWSKVMQKFQIEIVQNTIPYPLQKINAAYNPLGNIFTNLIASSLKSKNMNFNFVVINPGGFRTSWYPGIIRYAQLHSMLPFGNKMSFFQVTGLNLKKMIETIQCGKKGYYPTWGLSQIMKVNSDRSECKLISLVLADGSPIIDRQMYTGASLVFLTQGGDDFKGVTQYFSKVTVTEILMKVIIQQELQKLDQLSEQNLKDPTSLQRLVILQ